MRILYTVFLFYFSVNNYSCTQNLKESDVPSAVKQQLNMLHPGAMEIKWSKEDERFEAEFVVDGVESSVLFLSDGTIKETESEIPVNDLPADILNYVKDHFGGKKIEEAAKIMDDSGKVTYEAVIGGEDFIFDSTGKMIGNGSEKDN